MFTDSHCHLASYKYTEEELPQVIERAVSAGITRMVTLSTDLEDLLPNLELTERFKEVYCCLGIHPCDVTEVPDDAVAQVAAHLSKPKVSAVGECGLDYFHPAPKGWEEEAYHERQREFLEQHFQVAAEKGLNIVLHTRDKVGRQSFDDCLQIYEKYADKVRAVFHCFPGTVEQAERIISLGGVVSFTGNVTFKNAQQIQETASALPLGTFMLETDSPYLSPVPHRGKRNEPSMVKDIANHICTLKHISPAELSAATEKVVQEFYKLS